MTMLELRQVSKVYGHGAAEVHALVAAAGGWLLAGREPEAIARQPLD
jgi:hypothetical protein